MIKNVANYQQGREVIRTFQFRRKTPHVYRDIHRHLYFLKIHSGRLCHILAESAWYPVDKLWIYIKGNSYRHANTSNPWASMWCSCSTSLKAYSMRTSLRFPVLILVGRLTNLLRSMFLLGSKKRAVATYTLNKKLPEDLILYGLAGKYHLVLHRVPN